MWTRYSLPISVNRTLLDDLRATEIRGHPAANWSHLDGLGVLVMQSMRLSSRWSLAHGFDGAANPLAALAPNPPESRDDVRDHHRPTSRRLRVASTADKRSRLCTRRRNRRRPACRATRERKNRICRTLRL